MQWGFSGVGEGLDLLQGLRVLTGASQEWRLRVAQAVVQARLSYVSRTAGDVLQVLFSLILT